MALVVRLSRDDTIRQFRVAAKLRHDEALQLGASDCRAGAIYLYGYSAEMLLKSAYFRSIAKQQDDPIARADLNQAKTRGVQLNLAAPWNSGHSLRFWVELLIQSRIAASSPYAAHFASTLIRNVNCIAQNWDVSMRYRTNRPRSNELLEVSSAVNWLMHQSRLL